MCLDPNKFPVRRGDLRKTRRRLTVELPQPVTGQWPDEDSEHYGTEHLSDGDMALTMGKSNSRQTRSR
jgi:hypothetical protein